MAITKFCMCLVALLAAGYLSGQRTEDITTREVLGKVLDASGAPVPKAVVQLKDTKTLQIRSFITEADGSYHFAGLSVNTDYELKAQHDGIATGWKTLSIFNSKKVAKMNFKLRK